MAYREAVKYIESMNPAQSAIAAEDLSRVSRLVKSALPAMVGLPNKLTWRSEAREAYEKRLREGITLVEALYDAYHKAGQALKDYTAAQRKAKQHVADGVAAETKLGQLIRKCALYGWLTKSLDPLRQWEMLRQLGSLSSTFPLEVSGVSAIWNEANALYSRATTAYDDAIRVEQESRNDVVTRLKAAQSILPDFTLPGFLAKPGGAAHIIATTPGLEKEVHEAAKNPNARRPGHHVLRMYQVAGEEVVHILDEKLTTSELALLTKLPPWKFDTFESIRDKAFEEADRRFFSPDQNDDHNDAFRHAYWNALLSREFGEDWTAQYTTAHEKLPVNSAVREAMDLYNNELGRSIYRENPHATPEQLADLVADAVRKGRAVVVSTDGTNLEYSDQIRPEDTGEPQR